MKFIITALLLMAAFYCSAQTGYSIKGKLTRLGNKKVILVDVWDKFKKVDSFTAAGDTFEFRGRVQFPGMYLVSVEGVRARLRFILENKNLEITGAAAELNKAAVTGSPSNQLWDDFSKNVATPLSLKSLEYSKANNGVLEATPDSTRQAYTWNHFDKELETEKKKFILSNPSSAAALAVIASMGLDPAADTTKLIYDRLAKHLNSHPYFKILKTRFEGERATAIGQKAPVFTQRSANGKQISLAAFRGKYVLVDFWASWCGPCRKENPNLVAAYAKYKKYGFEILGVSLDRPGQKYKWLEAIKKDGLRWTQVSDLNGYDNKAAKMYAVDGIPENFLIDKNGIIIAKNLRGEDLEKKLAEILKK